MMEFKKKKVLITGGSRGIGKAIAQGYASHGAEVAITFRKENKLAEELIKSLPGSNHFYTVRYHG
jgi:3-oxoacyl-[acyl-carrier protein] reductase